MHDDLRPSDNVAGRIEGLDGLRAVAVLAVVAFHLWPDRFPGGFIGVDVFFVISGFLITTLLLRERSRAGWVDLPAFWKRRARRLLPTVAVVVPTSIVAAGLADRDLLVGIERQALGALTFSSNWLEVAAGSDYFDHTAPALFVTFWSLAVEEQFYVFWPLLVALVTTVVARPEGRISIALGLAMASAVAMGVLFSPGSNPTRVYHGTDTHLFGMMIGAALAFAFAGDIGALGTRRWQALRRWLGFAALAGLGVLVATIDPSAAITYRGGLVAASVLAAVAVAVLPGPATAYTSIARFRPLAWAGERSYGIYLWHWPVILVVSEWTPTVAPGAAPHPSTVVVALTATAVLAEVSYRWVEMPIRSGGFRAALAPLVGALADRPSGRGERVWGSRPLTAGLGLVVVVAVAFVAAAPGKSRAQLAVEAGERAMARQEHVVTPGSPPAGVASAGPVTTTLAGPPTVDATVAWPSTVPVPSGEMIVGFGDSVLSGAAPAMYRRFPGISLDAEPIRQWRDAPAIVAAAIADGTIRPVVVLNFGTNAGLGSDESRSALREVLDRLGPGRRVVLVNTVGISSWVPATNRELADTSARYPNTIVADWHAVVSADPGLLHSDRTHPNTRGIAAYADLIAASLERLGPG